MTDSATWLGRPRSAALRSPTACFRLSDPGAYQVVEVDLDGATLKSLNFVQALANAQYHEAFGRHAHHYAVPALRSAGLSLARIGHASALYQNWLNNDAFNSALSVSPPGP